jgi:hypothetical protein
MADNAVNTAAAVANATSAPSAPAFRPTQLRPQPTTAPVGMKITRFVTPIKIEFVVPSSQNAFNLNKSHLAILKLMKEKDPTMEVVPSQEGKAKFTDLLEFPANETDYNALFEHAVDKQPTDARKIIVRHSLITNLKFSDLKFQNAKLMDHMFTNKIWVHYNQSNSLQVAALGFIQGVHPRVTHRDGFLTELHDAIQLEMNETERLSIKNLLPAGKKQDLEEGEIAKPEIKLEVVARTLGYGNGDGRIKTEAFEIRVPLEIRVEIKEIMTRLGSKDLIPKGRFIPYGLVQTVGAEVYKKMLRMQNDYLTNFRIVPVFGITPKALKHVIAIYQDGREQQMTLQQFILDDESVRGIETTNRAEDLGKLFILSDAIGILGARSFVDNTLKELYQSETMAAELIHPNFNPPRRGDAPRISTTFQSYATALANLGNPQDDATPVGGIAPPPRPAKRNVQMVYDLQGDFPNLPKRHNQNRKTPPAGTPIQNHSNATSTTQNSTEAPSTVAPDALAQLREEMKKEFIQLIQTEVRTQIKNEMSAMQTEVVNLGIKIDSMQTSIRESIGAAIRDGLQASLGPPQQQQQQPQQNQPRQYFSHEVGLQSPATQYFDPNLAATPAGYTPQQTQAPSPQDATMHEDPTQQNSQDPSNTQDAAMQDLPGTCPTATGAQR